MHTRTRELLRDALLALLALGGLLGWLLGRGEARALRSPLSIVLGVSGSLLLEWAMLSRADLTRRLWDRREVRVGSLAGVVFGGISLGRAGARLVAALCWGLLAYLCLVVTVLVSGTNPLARLVNR
jgi:hypothetical protein